MTDKQIKSMQKMWERGVPARQIATVLGLTQSSVCNYAAHHRDRFPYRRKHATNEFRAEALAMCDSGMTPQRVAGELGVSATTVWRWLRDRNAGTWTTLSRDAIWQTDVNLEHMPSKYTFSYRGETVSVTMDELWGAALRLFGKEPEHAEQD